MQQQDKLSLDGKIDRLVEIRNDNNQSLYIESSNQEIRINDLYTKGANNIPIGGLNTIIDHKIYSTNISKSSCSFLINQFPFKCEKYSGRFLFNNYFKNDSKEYSYELSYVFLVDNDKNLKVELNTKNSQLCLQPKKIKILPAEYLDYAVAYDSNGNPVFLPFFQRMQFSISSILLDQNIDYCKNLTTINTDFIVFNNPDNNNLTILYKLANGNYGIIEPTGEPQETSVKDLQGNERKVIPQKDLYENSLTVDESIDTINKKNSSFIVFKNRTSENTF